MASKFEAGHAFVSIIPSMDGFHRRLQRELSKYNDEIKVPVDAETKKAQQNVDKLVDDVRKRTADVKVDADTAKAEAKIKELSARKNAATIQVDADIERAKARIAELEGKRGKTSIDVDAEISAAQAKIASLESKREAIQIKADADTATAEAKLAALANEADNVRRKSPVRVQVDAQGAERAVAIFSLITAGVAGVGLALPAATAGIAALSAGIGVLGATATTMIAGMDGVGEAIKAVNTVTDEMGDATKAQIDNMEDAMARLTDEGRSFVSFYTGDFRNAMKGIGDSVQSALLPQFELALRNVTSLTPMVREGLTQTAGVIGDLSVKASQMLTSGVFRSDFATLMAGNTRILGVLGEAGLNLADSFRSLMVTSLPLVTRLAEVTLESTRMFNYWVQGARQSGELNSFFATAGDLLIHLGSAIAATVTAIVRLSTALAPVGETLLSIITGLANFLGWVSQVNPGLVSFIGHVTLAGGALALMGRGLGGLVGVGQSAVRGFQNFGNTLANVFVPSRVNDTLNGWTAGLQRNMGAADNAAAGSGRMLSAVTRVGSYLPIAGLAVAGIATAVEIYNWQSQEAARKTQQFRDQAASLASTLDQATGAVTAQTREQIAHRLSQEGMIGRAKELGINTQQLVDAYTGEKEALAAVRGQLDQNILKTAEGSGLWKNYSRELQGAGITLDTLKLALGGNQQAIDLMNNSINRVGGIQNEVGGAIKLFTGDLERQGGAAGVLRSNLDASTRALLEQQIKVQEAALAMGTSTFTSKQLSDAQSVLKNEFAGSEEKARALRTALDILNGGQMEAREATRLLFEMTDGLAGKFTQAAANSGLMGLALLDAGGQFNLTTQAGRNLDQITNDLVIRMSDSATAAFNAAGGQTHLKEATDAARQQAQIARDEFVRSAQQLGFTAEEANHLADRYGLIPNDVVTAISTPGILEARAQAKGLTEDLKRIPNQVDIHINQLLSTTPVNGRRGDQSIPLPLGNAMGNIVQFANGGFAAGGLSPMSPIAQVVPPNTWRVVGDNMSVDEAYIPLDGSGRSMSILQEAARRMGTSIVPPGTKGMADGGMIGTLNAAAASAANNATEALPTPEQIQAITAAIDLLKVAVDALHAGIFTLTAAANLLNLSLSGTAANAATANASTGMLTISSDVLRNSLTLLGIAVSQANMNVMALTGSEYALQQAFIAQDTQARINNDTGIILHGTLAHWRTLTDELGAAVRGLNEQMRGLNADGLNPLVNQLNSSTIPTLQNLALHAGTLVPEAINKLHLQMNPLAVSFEDAGYRMRSQFQQTTDHIGTKNGEIQGHFRSLQDGMRATEHAIFLASEGIRTNWDRIKGYAHDPMKWVVDVVWNTGLLPIWNGVAEIFGQKPLGPVQFHNSGGPIFRAGGGGVPGPNVDRDVVPAMLTPGEYVLSRPAIANMGGIGAVHAAHMAARRGEKSALANFNTGGAVNPNGHTWPILWDIARGFGPDVRLTSSFRPGDSGYHGKGQAVDLASGNMPGLAEAINRKFPNATQIIMSAWRGGLNKLNGRDHRYTDGSYEGHFDHVHWAMTPAALGGATDPLSPGGMVDPRVFAAIDAMKKLKEKIDPGVNGFFGGRGELGWPTLQRGHAHKVLDGLLKKAEEHVAAASAMGGGFASANPEAVAAVRETARQFGWDQGPEWDALFQLVQHESGWNPNAANPTSSARGLFQKMVNIHGPLEPTPGGQALWGLNYIKGRYGSPSRAWSFWNAQSPHWYNQGGVVGDGKPTLYDSGGWLEPGPTYTYNGTRKPEAVLTSEDYALMHNAATNGGNVTTNIYAAPDWSSDRVGRAAGRHVEIALRN